jgi:protein transport protein HofB
MDKRLQTPGISTLTPPVEASASIVEQVNRSSNRPCASASDIHIEPGDDRLRIRLRVDGVLHSLAPLAPELAAPSPPDLKCSAIWISPSTGTAGRSVYPHARRPPDLVSIATLPCRGGKKSSCAYYQVEQALDLEALGLSSQQLAAFRSALNQPQGLMLVTGPTGSGKTVTLYSALQAESRRGQYMQR